MAWESSKIVLQPEGSERPKGFGDHHRVVSGLQAEIGVGVDMGRTLAADRQQRRAMVRAQPGRQIVNREAAVVVRQRDAIQLRPSATRDDVVSLAGDDFRERILNTNCTIKFLPPFETKCCGRMCPVCKTLLK